MGINIMNSYPFEVLPHAQQIVYFYFFSLSLHQLLEDSKANLWSSAATVQAFTCILCVNFHLFLSRFKCIFNWHIKHNYFLFEHKYFYLNKIFSSLISYSIFLLIFVLFCIFISCFITFQKRSVKNHYGPGQGVSQGFSVRKPMLVSTQQSHPYFEEIIR